MSSSSAVDASGDQSNTVQQIALPSPPTDGISRAIFHPFYDVLAVSSWDKTLRVYEISVSNEDERITGTPLATFTAQAPLLDCCFIPNDDDANGGYRVLTGGLDKIVRIYNVKSGQEQVLGEHDQAVSCVAAGKAPGAIFTAGWDSTVRQWNDKSETKQETVKCTLPERAYTMTLHDDSHCLIIGTAKRHIRIFDSSNMNAPPQERTSSLKHQTRCIRCFTDGTGYAVSSIEGRVGIEYVDQEVSQKYRYAFKCHRAENNGVTTVYPVNTLAFHPIYGTFATGGCDGSAVMWDGSNKRRVSNLGEYETSVSALSFNHSGTLIAVSASYTFEKGDQSHPTDQVYIRAVKTPEVQPKRKQPA
eukprot:gb/GECG01005457.1/.p1 GENE.gb/GECG01005457.1/~~gb/GECG01005457.1/.p1  ORF type:complete len:360 (+),score=43.43 gb/GECG01005457.1/:1-1080(+)